MIPGFKFLNPKRQKNESGCRAKILAYGWNAEKERVFTVAEMDDPQTVQKMMQTPEAAAIMAKAGTDKSSMEMIPLPNGKPGI